MAGMKTQTNAAMVNVTAAALLVAALGIVVQILFGAGQSDRLFAMDPIGDAVGLWLQLIAVSVATVAGVAAVLAPRAARGA